MNLKQANNAFLGSNQVSKIYLGSNLVYQSFQPFISHWYTGRSGETSSTELKIEAVDGYTYDFDIDWGDGTMDYNVTSTIVHDYGETYGGAVKIYRQFPALVLNYGNTDDRYKLHGVSQWGEIAWQDLQMEATFNMTFASSSSAPDLSNMTDLNRMFYSSDIDAQFGHWDISGITDMTYFLRDASQVSTANWDATLIGWAAQDVQNDVKVDANLCTYTPGGEAEAARQSLIDDHNWTVIDAGAA